MRKTTAIVIVLMALSMTLGSLSAYPVPMGESWVAVEGIPSRVKCIPR